MKLNKTLLLAGVVTTVAAGSLLGVNAASAHSSNSESMIDKIASKFNLNKDEVKAVFEEGREEKKAERKQEMSAKLQAKVDAGELTAEQKTLIEQKMTEQQAARETERAELEKWADDNGVDVSYVLGGGRGHKNATGKRLDNAVSSGNITEAQKTLIEEKRAELQTARDANRDAMKQWADDNGIELKDIMMGGRSGMGGPRN